MRDYNESQNSRKLKINFNNRTGRNLVRVLYYTLHVVQGPRENTASNLSLGILYPSWPNCI